MKGETSINRLDVWRKWALGDQKELPVSVVKACNDYNNYREPRFQGWSKDCLPIACLISKALGYPTAAQPTVLACPTGDCERMTGTRWPVFHHPAFFDNHECEWCRGIKIMRNSFSARTEAS